MKHKCLLLCFVFFLPLANIVSGQETDSINKVDENGLKQGKWRKKQNGLLRYEGQFRDDIPIGTFTYYYPDGKRKTVMTFRPGGEVSYAVNFHKNGLRLAEGKYVNKLKDSTWIYFDEKNIKVSEESYHQGVKHGAWKIFYTNGQASEVTTWKNDTKHGPWNMYFSDGAIRSRANYIDNQLQGLAQFFYASGKVMVSGIYKNSMKNGIWMTFKESGETLKKEVWKMGRLVEEEQISEEDEVKKFRDE